MIRRESLLRSLVWLCLFSAFSALICACTVGPNYRKPPEQMPAKWSETAHGVTDGTAEVSQWWTRFNDPELDSLIERAVLANKDLKIAEARVREARAQRRVVAADLYPTVDVSGAYSYSKRSENSSAALSSQAGAGGGNASQAGVAFDPQDLFQAGFDASWELDIFGGTRRAIEAADADTAAWEENRRDVLVTLLSEVARNYLQLRGDQLRIAIARDTIASQKQTVELTEVRFEAGLSSELDVSQARAQLATTQARIPALERSARQAVHQLGVLLGQEPGSLLDELLVEKPLPPVPPEVPIGLPSELLRRRPDIRRAERELAAATARIGVATADLFPSFSLTGAVGQLSTDISNIGSSGSTFYSIGPTIRWPIFDAGRIRANIQVQNARQEQSLISYERTVLVSLRDVEDALIAYTKEQATRTSLKDAVTANSRAFEIAGELYARGLVDFLNVLEAQRALYLTQDEFAQSEQRISSDLVALYKALGGGWDIAP